MFRFRLFGFPIMVHWLFWISAAYFSNPGSLSLPEQWYLLLARMAVIFLSILIHEMGHAIVMRHYGGRPRILLRETGGLATSPGLFQRDHTLIICLAGPIAGIMLWLATLAAQHLWPASTQLGRELYHMLVFANLFWSLFNLVPALPLDGGRFLEALMGPKAEASVGWTGVAASLAVCVFMVFTQDQISWTVIFFGYLAYLNYQHVSGHRDNATFSS